MKVIQTLSYSCLIIGLVLLFLASTASIAPSLLYPTPPEEYVKGQWGRSHKLENYSALSQKAGETDHNYLQRLTTNVADHLIHYWPEDQSYTAISIYDNYILWGLSQTSQFKHFKNYEFKSPEAALRRGYGFCSQASRIIYGLLANTHFDANIYNHANHVVTEIADNNGQKYIIDADYGTFIPHSLASMQNDSENLVKTHYKHFPEMQKTLTKIYGDGFKLAAEKSAFDTPRKFEETSSAIKWALALSLTTIGCLGIYISRTYKQK